MEYTKKAAKAIARAAALSKKLHHNYVGTEHLLAALAEDEETLAGKVLNTNNISGISVLELVEKFISESADYSAKTRKGNTPKLDALLERAIEEAKIAGSSEVATEHLLLAMIRMEDCAGARLINSMNVKNNKLFNDLVAGMGQEGAVYRNEISMQLRGRGNQQGESLLAQYSKDLTEMAVKGDIDPIIGRADEIKRVIQILSRRGKNNPCLVGEPGVGKTAIVEGLALRIASGAVPESIKNLRVVSLDLSAIVAGTRYRGDFEERIKKIISEVSAEGNIVLFVDEVHTLIGAGGAEGTMDAANILKPAMARGDVQILGATTISEYRKHIEKDAALERRFHPVMIEEPTVEETKLILKGVKHLYEEHHEVTITDEAVDACVELSERYINDRFLPDKAIDLMDEAAAALRLGHVKNAVLHSDLLDEIDALSERLEEAIVEGNLILAKEIKTKKDELTVAYNKKNKKNSKASSKKNLVLTEEDVAKVVALWTKIPVARLNEKESVRLKKLESILRKRIIGQEDAITAVSKAVRRGRVGLKVPTRPVGSFLFLGPTGVGKTEVCKALAEAVFGSEDAIIRVDMTEYMDKESVNKMIGSAPGYVGYEEGGQLAEKIRTNPYSVILFDEVEKAHPDVFNVLLQVLDDGHITDSHGRKVDFKNTIIIMTSNAGAQAIVDPKKMGFASKDEESHDYDRMKASVMDEVKRIFKPEFINRIDEITVFRQLNKDDMKKIVTLLTDDFAKRCKSQLDIEVSIPANVKSYIVEKAYDPKYGARPLRRKVQTLLEDTMSDAILNKDVKAGDVVKAALKKDKIVFVK